MDCRMRVKVMWSQIFVTTVIVLTCQLSVESTYNDDESGDDSCFCQVTLYHHTA